MPKDKVPPGVFILTRREPTTQTMAWSMLVCKTLIRPGSIISVPSCYNIFSRLTFTNIDPSTRVLAADAAQLLAELPIPGLSDNTVLN
jgi:hypothetical protein